MSCQQLVSDMRDGLGFSGFTSAHLVQNKLSVNVTRLVMTLVAMLLGLGALICGIGTCTAAALTVISLAGGASIALGLVLLMLASYWGYGAISSYRNRSAQLAPNP
ncbi:hypothetical protein [Chlamydia psittaci]|uniref:hypothetical protein n=1 Tax=Chlamydia psittaci TaxID=83554 RepID=UPI00027E1509|nr:hypothetical protein [Chlamydia psittaci]EPJ24646.1 putative transmembrane protein [Chlamydia psittaci 09DC77]AFS21324.1 putative transmembrane protein [Chlamydia psittaci MN]AFS27112.1 putative transmembrane protein [Chlamydia psittaci CP3]KPZ36003.1 membrane protein [Chlamydia psittaci CP3]KPZ39650.1 membrane protein [Chlamydia psittaci str. Frances]